MRPRGWGCCSRLAPSGEGDLVVEEPGFVAVGQLHHNADALAIHSAEAGHGGAGVGFERLDHVGGDAVTHPGDAHLGTDVDAGWGGSLGHGRRNRRVAPP